MNKNTQVAAATKKTKITITEEGLKANKPLPLSDITNMALNSLLAVYVAKTDETNRDALYAMLALAFSNVLAYYAPDKYFEQVSEDEMLADEEKVRLAAQNYPDNIEEVRKIQEDLKGKFSDSYQPGESGIFDESGRAYFPADTE